ncbi:NAD-dependent epimerase/dehydratase family protein [Halanaerobaculum tunisiense]
MKILVTGAAGFIGSTVVDTLYPDFKDIRAVDNFSIGTVEQIHGIEVENMDVRSEEDAKEMVKGVDVVIHFAGMTGIPLCEDKDKKAAVNNLVGTKNLVDAAVEEGVEQFIYASSFATLGNPPKYIDEDTPTEPINFYGNLRRSCEHLINAAEELYGMKSVIFRQSNMYGKGLCEKRSLINIMADKILNKEPMTVFGTGRQIRNFLHVRDTAKAYKLAIEQEASGTYNLGGYENISVNQVVETANEVAEEILGYTVPIEHLEDRGAGKKEIDLEEFTFDISKIQNELGLDPELTVRDAFYELLTSISKVEDEVAVTKE